MAPDANQRRCQKCDFKLFPVGQVRKIRFHHLRHTTASLLLMSGADLAAVQRIMRHQDPRMTTDFYGHLGTTYLKKQMEHLSFGPAPADTSGAADAGDEQRRLLAAGGAQEPPLPAVTRDETRPAALFVTRLVPKPQTPSKRPPAAEPLERLYADLELSGREDLNLRPFGPEPNALPGCATPRW